jgi:hypothetical protein
MKTDKPTAGRTRNKKPQQPKYLEHCHQQGPGLRTIGFLTCPGLIRCAESLRPPGEFRYIAGRINVASRDPSRQRVVAQRGDQKGRTERVAAEIMEKIRMNGHPLVATQHARKGGFNPRLHVIARTCQSCIRNECGAAPRRQRRAIQLASNRHWQFLQKTNSPGNHVIRQHFC